MNDVVKIDLKGRKLYELTAMGFRMPHYVDEDEKAHDQPAENIPLLFWPNGRWCGPANTFLREAFEKGHSRFNRGGTLAASCAHLSLFIRFTFSIGKEFIDLTDSDFRHFINLLTTEKNYTATGQRRAHNSVITIGKTCLAFLECIGRSVGIDDFLGPHGQIRANRVELGSERVGANTKSSYHPTPGWTHNCFPKPNEFKKRLPIGQQSIDGLRLAVGKISRSSHLKQRRHTMLKILESTGCRRGEAVLIKVTDIEKAIRMDRPMITLPLLKRKDINKRVLPISRADLGFIKLYIDVHRQSVMRRKFRGKHDHGFLLVNERTGKPLTPRTITQEVRLLAHAAGIRQQACPHMFRHRFFTKIVVMLIKEFTIQTPDEFRRSLLDGHALRKRAMEWTGHAHPESLTPYVDLAFDELTNAERVISHVEADLALDSYRELLGVEMLALADGEDPGVVTERIINWTECMKSDLMVRRPKS